MSRVLARRKPLMGQNIVIGKMFFKKRKKGYALLTAIVAVNIFAILALTARSMWETEAQLDLEEELLYRARQYKTAIELYLKKNVNVYPTNLEILYEKKCLRKLFKDPMTESGEWNIVMRGGTGGQKGLLLVPEAMVEQYITKARIVGVCSTSIEEGIREYRGKKRYCEWAVYVGEKLDKDMPELKFVGDAREEERGEGGREERGEDLE
jgi:type II secretory pathway pseudopilin PulG